MAPFYGWGSTLLRLQSHCEETIYFLHSSLLSTQVAKYCLIKNVLLIFLLYVYIYVIWSCSKINCCFLACLDICNDCYNFTFGKSATCVILIYLGQSIARMLDFSNGNNYVTVT